ncbi:MAG: leucine-rich repeat domain-containing protein [Clostridia bacterium]|nr:leucine-rich repeat domain-containing protein [Clostridia bacterium]
MSEDMSDLGLASFDKSEKNDTKMSRGLIYRKGEVSCTVESVGTCGDSVVIIPSRHDGLLVTKIESGAFVNCEFMISLCFGSEIAVVDDMAFVFCDTLKRIYFRGSKDDWDKISFGKGNDVLKEATLYLFSEKNPGLQGNFWHWDKNGKAEVW